MTLRTPGQVVVKITLDDKVVALLERLVKAVEQLNETAIHIEEKQ